MEDYILRVILILSAAIAFSVLATAARPAEKTQERAELSRTQVIQSFWKHARKQHRFNAVFRPKELCKPVRKAIRFYRNKTWSWEDKLDEPRSVTYFPERFPSRCAYLRWNVKQWRGKAAAGRNRWYSVDRTDPEYIIRSVFPEYSEYRALGVANCESNLNTYAQNSSSGTSGLFQIHPGNRGRVIHWSGHGSIVIAGNLFDPWNNARIALYMSKGGVDWHEWAGVCQR